jgi:hypothetical protein
MKILVFPKKCLLLLLFAVGTVSAHAQSWQVGVQQGISYWLTRRIVGIDRLQTRPGQHLTWDKELILKYQSTRKLGFELGLGTYHFRQQTPGTIGDSILQVDGDTHALSLRMAVVYDVTYPLLGYMFPKMAGMKSYIGFICTPTLLWDNAAVTSRTEEQYQFRRTCFSMWVGFSYTHEFPLTKRLFLISQLAFQGKPFIKYRINEDVMPYANKRVNIQSGLRIKL